MLSEMESGKIENDGPGSGHNDDVTPSSSSSASTTTVGDGTIQVLDGSHGWKFEWDLLALFCVRGLAAGYEFELAKEREDLGGKFDDLIFRYQVSNEICEGKHWRYRFLQAKHKQNENEKIKATHLIDGNDFNLLKYFRSFCMMRKGSEDIHDCIICTNIGFDIDDVKKNGIELVSINDPPEDIFMFGPPEKTPRYQLKFTEEFRDKALKEWSDIYCLAEQLQKWAPTEKTIELRTGVFSNYHVALVNEQVIDLKTKMFHQDFVNDAKSLFDGAKQLRQILNDLAGNDWKNWKFKLSKTFGKSQPNAETENGLPLKIENKDLDAFLEKFVFVVNMPSRKDFEEILQTKDVSKYYPREECKTQTALFWKEMSEIFTHKEKGSWLKSEEAKEILLEGVKKISIEYQTQLGNEVGFNEEAKKTMANELQKMLKSNNTIERITTLSPKHTAVKVISAIPELQQKHAASISHLVISSSQLQSKEDAERWKNVFQLPNYSGHSLLVVCDDGEQPFQDDHVAQMGEGEKTKRHKVIVISRKKAASGNSSADEIKYTQLDESFKQKILSIKVSFQEETVTVERLVGPKPEDVLDSLKELLRPEGGQIIIPSFDSSRFEKSLYIKRRVKFAFDDRFIADLAKRLECSEEKLNGECRISSQGQIEWLVYDERRKEIWENIKQMNDQTSGKIEEDSHLIQLDEEPTEHPVVIICGMAGTGKSTLLSHYYNEIKKKKPGCWIIRLNLIEHSDAMLKLDRSKPDFIRFLIDHQHVIGNKCPFSRSLLNHRLETGEQIVFMFDGYDEIGEECQEIAIQLMKFVQEKKGIQLYVTTRSHVAHHLQNELCQLAYYLDNFNKEDQINCLAKYWKKVFELPDGVQEMKIKKIEEFATLLVDRVSDTLKDDERTCIGIPLQCRILGVCYLQTVGDIVGNTGDVIRQCDELISSEPLRLFDNEKFDLVSLYSKLMETKRKIFLVEKTNASKYDEIKDDAITILLKKMESYLTKLALETIITEPNILEMLGPTKSPYESSDDVGREESILAKNTLKFGLTFSNRDGMRQEFMHRTFAEYLVAKYLYEGFHLDDEHHNKLLENESIRKLILNKILASKQYDGVQMFFDGMVKTLVDEDKESCRLIVRRKLPDRLKKLTENLFSPSMFTNALFSAVSNGRGNIFLLLCDCLDATFERRQILWPFQFAVVEYNLPISSLFLKENKLFRRFINYLDIGTDDENTCRVVGKLIDAMFPYKYGSINRNSFWNRDGHQQTLNELLLILENQHVAFSKTNDSDIKKILVFFNGEVYGVTSSNIVR
ncbi:uncharacterized protein LOC132087700 [Daphnia carinata]|uniref:uncharacterized protein LOC132087700 n=1 Tax=Daphnia carinata TaxID=120202 RepID=UPI0025800D79|nr:uncharacterized protein LOC132087700 [Daphnia carinata]